MINSQKKWLWGNEYSYMRSSSISHKTSSWILAQFHDCKHLLKFMLSLIILFFTSEKASVVSPHWSIAVYHKHPATCWLWTDLSVIQGLIISCTARTHKHTHSIKLLSISRKKCLTLMMPTISLHYSPKTKPYFLWVRVSTHLIHNIK